MSKHINIDTPTNSELKQAIYDVLNTHKPTDCSTNPCPAVIELEALINNQIIEEALWWNDVVVRHSEVLGLIMGSKERAKQMLDEASERLTQLRTTK